MNLIQTYNTVKLRKVNALILPKTDNSNCQEEMTNSLSTRNAVAIAVEIELTPYGSRRCARSVTRHVTISAHKRMMSRIANSVPLRRIRKVCRGLRYLAYRMFYSFKGRVEMPPQKPWFASMELCRRLGLNATNSQ